MPAQNVALINYLKTCTAPDARLLLTWFAPEVLYFAQRGAAGGMVVFSGDHWSSDADQRRTVAQMHAQHVPIVVMRGTVEEFARPFPVLAAELADAYLPAGTLPGPEPEDPDARFYILIRRELAAAPLVAPWNLPCPAR
jgi:hypothetical protein